MSNLQITMILKPGRKAGIQETLSSESLIMAQDERWRRA
jgi:hypothetical protein